jgi:hypothetical protein
MIEQVVITATISAIGAIALDEFNIDIYAPAKKKLANYTVVQALGKASEYIAWKKSKVLVAAEQKILKRVMGRTAHYLWGTTKVTIVIHHEDLHEVRSILRQHYGQWSDKVEPSYCANDKLTVNYVGAMRGIPVPIELNTNYPLDNLPKGLLKPGCHVERTSSVVESCSIVCEGGA